jgi:hypothetical protein
LWKEPHHQKLTVCFNFLENLSSKVSCFSPSNPKKGSIHPNKYFEGVVIVETVVAVVIVVTVSCGSGESGDSDDRDRVVTW